VTEEIGVRPALWIDTTGDFETFPYQQFNKAEEMAEQGEYKEAAALLDTLGNYNNSIATAGEYRYHVAMEAVMSEDFDKGIELLEKLDGYKDSNQVGRMARYNYAVICDLLRRDLGYEGVVVSDFAAVHHNKIQAHVCGMMDIELAPVEVQSQELMKAGLEGTLEESAIDESLERVLDLADRLYETEPAQVNMEELHREAHKMAAQCMVLLRNTGILPLEKKQFTSKKRELLVTGALAEDPSYMGGGSGHMNGWKVDTYLEEIRKYVPEAKYAPGYLLKQG